MTGDDRESDIRELDPETVTRIAAGEVVERPASVVKELVENSLDAGADRVAVRVETGGVDGVTVRDDGHGMTEADVRAAVREHTTSKLPDGDLASVETLGFRGEALHTIGAVSRTTITTRARGADRATELRVEGGEVTGVGPAGRPVGTTVEVADLFYNTPARRKYLGTPATEFGHVNRVVTRYALANPDVAVSLMHDDNEVFATDGRGELRGTVLAVYGREVAESMRPVDAGGDAVDRVHGLVSHPETTRANREYLATFVNGRYVRDATLRDAVLAAYGTQLAADRYPFAVLSVEVPPDRVDANVHPRKMEVRFDDEAAVADAVTGAVEEGLLDAGIRRSGAPRGASAPPEADVAPGSGAPGDGDEPATDDGDADGRATAGDGLAPGAPTDRAVDETDDAPGSTPREAVEAPSGAETDPSPRAADDPDGAVDAGGRTDAGAEAGRAADPDATAASGSAGTTPANGSETDAGADDARSGASPPGAPTDRKFRPATRNASLGADDRGPDGAVALDSLPRMRLLGQLHDTYLVAETPEGLALVDQHAADERVNYERLARRLADGAERQRLVSPVELELTAGEAAVFRTVAEDLRAAGFTATLDADGRTAVVRAVPAVLADALDPETLRDVLAGVLREDRADVLDSAADALLADMACYPSVTGNTALREGDAVSLLSALDDCENPWACPHGRPTVVELDAAELGTRFERDYPGHAVRRPEE
ncbi:MAG: DNA mismatch repair endonuclease MutL [Halobacteriaceae archaeon]